MTANTTTGRFKAPSEKVFNFLSNADNLPKWATGFCKELIREGSDYKVVTTEGTVYFDIQSDHKTGIIDMYTGVSKDAMTRWPGRVTDDNTGGSVFAFTAIQMEGVTNAEFAQQCAGLKEEFENIRRMVDA